MHACSITPALLLTLAVAFGCTRTAEVDVAGPIGHHRQALQMESIGSSHVLASMASIQRRTVQAGSTTIPLQIYIPRGTGPFPTVLLLPSIDFVAGDPVTHDRIARSVAAETPALVVVPQLGLLPETDWPTVLYQASVVLEWLPDQVKRWDGDPDCVVVLGEGSGGALAADLSTRMPERIELCILVMPILDLRPDAWNARPWYAGMVAGNERSAESLSPLAREAADASPTYVLTGSEDPARAQGLEWSRRLEAIDVQTTHRTIDGRGALGMDWATMGPGMLELVLDVAREIRSTCDGG